ncbi:hypothetical protein BD770DRAFT_382921, partial [Pilaira anomala]
MILKRSSEECLVFIRYINQPNFSILSTQFKLLLSSVLNMVNLTTYMIATACLVAGIQALDQSAAQKIEEVLEASNILPSASAAAAAPKPSAAPGCFFKFFFIFFISFFL